MFENKFTTRGGRAIGFASDIATKLGHNYVGTEHILAGILEEGSCPSAKILKNQGISGSDIIPEIARFVGIGTMKSGKVSGLTPRARCIIEMSVDIAKEQGATKLDTHHLMLGILSEGNNIALSLLFTLGVDTDSVYRDILTKENKECFMANDKNNNTTNTQKKDMKHLEKVAIDLTEMAAQGKLDPLIGREAELNRLCEILLRRMKNNPAIIGEPGVGKTAIIEGLAQKIQSGNCPEGLKDARILSIDLASVLAGTKYRGEFEERLKNIVADAKKSPDVILFIDEFHNIVGAGAAEGAIDAANILKPALSRGEIKIIGATTYAEYKKSIEKDAALERRFQVIEIKEPKKDKAIEILDGIRPHLEEHHKLKISRCAIEAAVELSIRYIPDKFLPDKAIDLLDEAGAKLNISQQSERGIELENKIKALNQQKFLAIKSQNYALAAKFRDDELKIKVMLEQSKIYNKNSILKREDICNLIEIQTGIKTSNTNKDEVDNLLKLENSISSKLIGQKDAVKALTKAIRKNRAGLGDPNRPVGSFLFLGPTGVGKTQMAKALASALFFDEKAFIKLDMSEFMEAHSVSKILGAPPGYKGFDSYISFTEKIRRNPYSVILFDEIEKAYPDILNILLQILEDGNLTDSTGRKINFKNTIIIMTSNIGATRIVQTGNKLGFGVNDDTKDNIKSDVLKSLKKILKPELLNRIDDTVIFTKLAGDELELIAEYILNNINTRTLEKGIKLSWNKNALEFFVSKTKSSEYGARPIRRFIEDSLENLIADKILSGEISSGDLVEISVKDDNLITNTCKL